VDRTPQKASQASFALTYRWNSTTDRYIQRRRCIL